MAPRPLSLALAVLLGAHAVLAAPQLTPTSYLNYVPDLAGNAIFGALYAAASVALWTHTVRWRAWHAVVLPIATTTEALGWFIRIPLRQEANQDNRGLYIAYYLFLVLSPAGFLAYAYIVYGRLISAVDPELIDRTGLKAKSRYSFIPPRLVARFFVISDICTFLVQAAGGGLQTGGDYQQTQLGNKIFLAGVSGQGASYVLFTLLTLVAHIRLCREEPRYAPWHALHNKTARLFVLLYIASLGILVRSGMRIVEMAQGYGGQLYSNEIYTFTLDGLPLIIAVGVFAVWYHHPLILATQADAQARAAELGLKRESASTSASSPDEMVERRDAARTPESHVA